MLCLKSSSPHLTSGPAPGGEPGAVGFPVPLEGGAGPEVGAHALLADWGCPLYEGGSRGPLSVRVPFCGGRPGLSTSGRLLREGPGALGPPARAAGAVGAVGAGGGR